MRNGRLWGVGSAPMESQTGPPSAGAGWRTNPGDGGSEAVGSAEGVVVGGGVLGILVSHDGVVIVVAPTEHAPSATPRTVERNNCRRMTHPRFVVPSPVATDRRAVRELADVTPIGSPRCACAHWTRPCRPPSVRAIRVLQ